MTSPCEFSPRHRPVSPPLVTVVDLLDAMDVFGDPEHVCDRAARALFDVGAST